MDTAQTLLTGGNQTQQIGTLTNTALWIAGIAGAVVLVWLVTLTLNKRH